MDNSDLMFCIPVLLDTLVICGFILILYTMGAEKQAFNLIELKDWKD